MTAPSKNIMALMNEMMELYGQGRFMQAFERAEQEASNFPEEQGRIVFSQACLLSKAGRGEQTIDFLRSALERGLWWQQDMFLDPDFDNLRELEEFKQVVSLSQQNLEKAVKNIQPARTVLVPENKAAHYPLIIALHGHGSNMDRHAARWQLACERDWLVLLPQSTSAIFSGAYSWDDPEQGMRDILLQYHRISKEHPIDTERILLAGFSQGGGMALITALSGRIPARGFIGIGTWWEDVEQIARLAGHRQSHLRAYFIIGEKDHTLERTREIQEALMKNHVPVREECHKDLGHEFSADFDASFEKATAFIFEEEQ